MLGAPEKVAYNFKTLHSLTCPHGTMHTVFYWFQMPTKEDASNSLIFWSNFIGKTVERKTFGIHIHGPFEKILSGGG